MTIIKRIDKIGKLFFLITARQGWKLGRNLYLLIREPDQTIRSLWKDKDKSQIFLLVIVFLAPIWGYFGLRISFDELKYGFIKPGYGGVFAGAIGMEIVIFLFLGYWIYRIRKNR